MTRRTPKPPPGATLHLGGNAWAHPDLEPTLIPHTGDPDQGDVLTPYPGNPRRGDQDAITASIADLGLYRTLIAQRSTGHVLAGNHTLRALTDLGATQVPVTWVDVDNTRAAAIVARDNRTSELGTYDDADLLALLTADPDVLPLSGYDDDALTALLTATEPAPLTPVVDAPTLADRFVVPPFTVLDQRGGAWQDRKRRWLALGIQSEVGRGVEVSPHPEAVEEVTERVADVSEGSDLWVESRAALAAAVKAKGWRHRDLDAHLGTNGMAGHYLGSSQPMTPTPEQWARLAEVLDFPVHLMQPMTETRTRPGAITATGRGPKGLGAVQTNLDGKDAARYGRTRANALNVPQGGGGRGGLVERTLAQGLQAHRDPETGELTYTETTAAGVSIFDPVLTELAYRWFSPPGGHVLDPFAGGSVRGIVAAALGRSYTGIELRAEQVTANRAQVPILDRIPDAGTAAWLEGDSREVLPTLDVQADLLFSCPPYADLEVYSDDPADLSTMPYDEFLTAYRQIIAAALERLRDDRFAVWVIGEVRDRRGLYRGLVPDTIRAFTDAGAALYNEAILVTPVGSLPIRAGRQFAAGRKLGKTHQNVLVFCKGDPRAAADACGTVEVVMPEPTTDLQ